MPLDPLEVDGLEGAVLAPDPAEGPCKPPEEPAPVAAPPDDDGAPRVSL